LGLPALRAHLKEALGFQSLDSGVISARRRHLDALGRTAEALGAAQDRLLSGTSSELVAEELKLAHDALSEITGRFTSDDLLGEIFSSFCIGK
jgi:tRNA modification GTPase